MKPPQVLERSSADPAPRARELTHTTPSGLTATDALKMACPNCGASESAVWRKWAGGVECPNCGATASRVVKAKGLIQADAIRRRRECACCGERFPTTEAVDRELYEARKAAARITEIRDFTMPGPGRVQLPHQAPAV